MFDVCCVLTVRNIYHTDLIIHNGMASHKKKMDNRSCIICFVVCSIILDGVIVNGKGIYLRSVVSEFY